MISKKFLPGRIGKAIRERYINHLKKQSKPKMFLPKHDTQLIENSKNKQLDWAKVKEQMPDFSECALKDRYY
jgi:hypothetical protein